MMLLFSEYLSVFLNYEDRFLIIQYEKWKKEINNYI